MGIPCFNDHRIKFALFFRLIFFATIGWSSLSIFSQSPNESVVQKVSASQAIQQTIQKDETYTYLIDLKKNQFLHADIQQSPGFDLIVAIYSPNGTLLNDLNSKGGKLWREEISWIAPEDGEYKIEVETIPPNFLKGTFSLKIDELRESNGIDNLRIAAEKALGEGRKAYEKRGDGVGESIKLFEKALGLWKQIGDRYWEAVSQINLGISYSELNLGEKAIASHTDALSIFKEIKDRTGEGKAINGLGIAYQNLKQYQKAVEYYQQAIVIRHDLKDLVGEHGTIRNLAVLYRNMSQPEKSLDYFERALVISREIKDLATEASINNWMAWVKEDLGQTEQAILYFEQSLTIYKQINDRTSMIVLLNNLGTRYTRLKQFEKSQNYFDQAFTIIKEINNQSWQAQTLINSAYLYGAMGLLDKAINNCEQALIIYRQMKNLNREAYTFLELGYFSHWKGVEGKSLEYYQTGLDIFRKIKNREGEAICLNGLANVNRSLFRSEQAKNFYEQSLVIYREINNVRRQTHALNGIGLSLSDLGQFAKAKPFFEEALSKWRSLKDSGKTFDEEISMLDNLGICAFNLQQYDLGKDYFQEAISILEKLKDHNGKGNQLVQLGYRLNYAGYENKYRFSNSAQADIFFNESNKYLEEAIKIFEETNNDFGKAYALYHLSSTSYYLNNKEKQRQSSEKSLEIYQILKQKKDISSLLNSLMYVWNNAGNKPLAIFYGKQTINSFQELIKDKDYFDQDGAKQFLKSKAGVYRELADILISEGRLPEAREVLDLLKEEEFSGLISRGGTDVKRVSYTRDEQKAVDLSNNLITIKTEYAQLSNRNSDPSQSDSSKLQLNQLLESVKTTTEKYQRSLAELNSGEKNNLSLNIVTEDADKMRADLKNLGSNAVAIYTVISNENESADISSQTQPNSKSKFGWTILVTPESTKVYPIEVANLPKVIFTFRQTLSSPEFDPEPLARELYKRIFLQTSAKQRTTLAADLDEYFKGKSERTLLWSLDGILRYIPMAALHDGNGYLVEKYRNVVFNTASKARLKDEVTAKWTALGLGVSEKRTEQGINFPALLGVNYELLSIIKDKTSSKGILPGVVKVNKDFTRQSVIDGLSQNNKPQVVHISSHFSFQAADFNQSFLLLGEGSWSVEEMSQEKNLFKDVDLVTLSACDTAMGQANGKDAEGFAYLVQSLGAKAVMATLWEVADISTEELMPQFYREKEKGLEKAEALRQAQLVMLKGENWKQKKEVKSSGIIQFDKNPLELSPYQNGGKPNFAHPFYWAPFILIGNAK